jgi:hypothetical protein
MSLVSDSPGFQRRLLQLSPASDRVWILAMSIGLGFTLLAAYPFAHTPSGNFWAYAGLLLRSGLYLWAGEALAERGGQVFYRLFLLGLVAGLLEILIDWALIHWVPTGRLVYLTGNDVVLLGSPIWMPLAWACVIVELGYPALRLYGILIRALRPARALGLASMLIGMAAGITVGFYEYFAFRADWWRYEPAHAMLGGFCAWYVPLGEVFMFLPVIPIVRRALEPERPSLATTLEAGAGFALSIAAGYALAYLLLEVLFFR